MLNGLLTFVAGFVAVGVLLFLDVALSSSGSPTGGTTSTGGNELLYVIGWIFYNAQFVDVAAAGQSMNLLSLLGGFTTVPTVVSHAIPPVLLLAPGRSVARKAARGRTDEQRTVAGASILAGYLPLALVGSSLLTYEVSTFGTTTSVGPETTTAVLIAGIGYPVIFGGLGGYFAD